MVWRRDDDSLRYRYSLCGTSSSSVIERYQPYRNRAIENQMTHLRDLLILNLTLQAFDDLFSYQLSRLVQ